MSTTYNDGEYVYKAGKVIGLINPDGTVYEFGKHLPAGALTAGQVAGLQAKGRSQRAARVFFNRLGTVDNSTAKTYHVAAEMAQQFDAISPILVNSSATAGSYFLCKVSVSGAFGDGNNSAGTWVNVTNEGNDTALMTRIAYPSGERPSFTIGRPTAIRSVARTDGGTYPLVFCRAYALDSNASLPVYGNGSTDVLTGWADRLTGRRWLARYQNGDQYTTPSGFTDTTNRSQSPIIGFVYWSRGAVVSIASCGDSIGNGQGTLIGEGWATLLADQLQSSIGVPVEYCNMSLAGQSALNLTSGSGFYQRALDLLRADVVRPSVLMIPAGSFNPVAAPLTQAQVDAQATMLRRVMAEAASRRVPVMLYTWSPATTGTAAYGTSDALRVAYNQEIVSGYASGVQGVAVADFSAGVSGDTASGMVQLTDAYTTDGLHPNDAGNAVLAAIALPAAQSLLPGVQL